MNQLYRSSFRSLWESIYGAENWQANPWFGLSSSSAFKVVQHERRTIDQANELAERRLI
jgi:hypothetical protein